MEEVPQQKTQEDKRRYFKIVIFHAEVLSKIAAYCEDKLSKISPNSWIQIFPPCEGLTSIFAFVHLYFQSCFRTRVSSLQNAFFIPNLVGPTTILWLKEPQFGNSSLQNGYEDLLKYFSCPNTLSSSQVDDIRIPERHLHALNKNWESEPDFQQRESPLRMESLIEVAEVKAEEKSDIKEVFRREKEEKEERTNSHHEEAHFELKGQVAVEVATEERDNSTNPDNILTQTIFSEKWEEEREAKLEAKNEPIHNSDNRESEIELKQCISIQTELMSPHDLSFETHEKVLSESKKLRTIKQQSFKANVSTGSRTPEKIMGLILAEGDTSKSSRITTKEFWKLIRDDSMKKRTYREVKDFIYTNLGSFGVGQLSSNENQVRKLLALDEF